MPKKEKTTTKRKAGKKRNPALLPLFTVWFLAVVVLASLIYWGGPSSQNATGTRKSGPVSEAASNRASSEPARSVPRSPASTAKETIGPPAAQGPGAERERTESELALRLSPPAAPELEPEPKTRPIPLPPQGFAAIVIDDFGQDIDIANQFLSLPFPVTFSVLPHLRHSREVAERVHARGRELIVHMPMEPQGFPETDPGPGALLLSMTEEQVEETLQAALDATPYAVGMNNHMGSRFTEDPEKMRIVLRELRRRGLFFLDSYTSAKTAGLSSARDLQVPALRRDIFLDHIPTEAFVRKQVQALIRKAKVEGTAVAIGHPHAITLKVLAEEAPRFEKEGVQVVPLSVLLRKVNGDVASG
jgi:polysaccharide deacetylase 2 family uncharacterized protein YibQ